MIDGEGRGSDDRSQGYGVATVPGNQGAKPAYAELEGWQLYTYVMEWWLVDASRQSSPQKQTNGHLHNHN